MKKLEDKEETAFVLKSLINFNDVRMVEVGSNFELIDENAGIFNFSFGYSFDDS